MNQHTRELATLKEFQRIYTETPLTIGRYKRYQLIVSIIGLGLILLSLFGGSIGFLAFREAVIAAMFGGMAAGISFLYRSSLHQIPFLIQFTALDVPAIQNRIQEIEDLANK
jgi:hypothetical protein